jgi:hypothetical protein
MMFWGDLITFVLFLRFFCQFLETWYFPSLNSPAKSGMDEKKTGEKYEKRESVDAKPVPLVAVPSKGLCAFIIDGRPNSKNGLDIGTAQLSGSHITFSRHKSKLRLKLDHEATNATIPWITPISIRHQFMSSDRFVLSTEQKLQLAYQVGSSLFYLHFASWLRDDWDGEDVYLPWQSDGVVFLEPLLVKQLNQKRTSIDSCNPTENAPRIPPIITSLSRFLIELCCGAPWKLIREVFLAGYLTPPKSTDLAIFNEISSWIESPKVAIKDKPCHLEGWSYFEAIRNCSLGDFGQKLKARSMGDEEFQIGVYQHILRPLQFALEDFKAQQIRIFGPPIIEKLGENIPPVISEGNKSSMLFDDDEVMGDAATVKRK